VCEAFVTEETLHIITPIFNHNHYQAIYNNYRRYAEAMARHPNVTLWTIECALGERSFQVTQADNPHHIQVRNNSSIFIKERLATLTIQRLPDDARKIGLVDGDILFLDQNWVEKTLLALDHYDVIQPWSDALFTGPDGEKVGTVESFMYQYMKGDQWPGHPPKRYGKLWHPGFATCYTREFLDKVGLFDLAVIGHGDSHMAQAFIGRADEIVSPKDPKSTRHALSAAYRHALLEYQQRCDEFLRGNIGAIKGTIVHYWHGRQVDRRYEDRWSVLIDNGFDPTKHIRANRYGVWDWVEHYGTGHRDASRRYFSGRNDDANCR
jgi:hypothetical protein